MVLEKEWEFVEAKENEKVYILEEKDESSTTDDKKEDELFPEKFFLSQNYPNPFNPITNIKYEIPKTSKVEINVYDISGQRVKTLVDEIKAPGYWSTYWDGSNNFGQRVSSGMYLYTIVTKQYKKSRKLIFMK